MVETTGAGVYGFDLGRAAADRRPHRPDRRRGARAARTVRLPDRLHLQRVRRASRSSSPGDTRSTEPRGTSWTDPVRRSAKQQQRSREIEADAGRDLVDRGHRRVGDRSGASCGGAAAAARPRGPDRPHPVRHGRRWAGIPVFGAGWFGVQARHGRVEGEYPLFMPMTTEQSTIGGRETFGEPKKIGAVPSTRRRHDRCGHGSTAWASRWPRSPAARGPDRHPYEGEDRLLVQVQPVARRQGLRPEPALVYGEARGGARRPRDRRRGDARGTRRSTRSPTSRSAASCRWSSPRSPRPRTAEVIEPVPADWLLPFLHQRYDDLSVLGKKD